ncbi:unnamed protein product [Clonostachys rhizophaga]|uniref:PNPLA domain-containing protein n=1 Tax=Clonostachys rhizophaga TaxID=160324 RepID=A0A9N9VQ90_9HYPO|nr:unnamed protein product [Clonostachys rhizophaga]
MPDGGGVKGYSSLLILRTLMSLVARVEAGVRNGNSDDEMPDNASYPWFEEEDGVDPGLQWSNWCPPCYYFEYIAGTSTGALSAIMLGRLRNSVNDVLREYTTFGNEVFGKPRWFHQQNIILLPRQKYCTRAVEATLRNIIGQENGRERRFPSNETQCKTMAVAYAEDQGQAIQEHYLFRTYDHYQNQWASPVMNPGRANNLPIWKVARATSAAPLYFEALVTDPGTEIQGRKKFLDGGLGANNPTFIALREVLQITNPANPHQAKCLLVSIGTGLARPPNPNIASPHPDEAMEPEQLSTCSWLTGKLFKYGFAIHRAVGNLLWLRSVFLKYALNSQRIHLNEVLFATEAAGIPYYRLNVDDGVNNIALDTWEPADGGGTTLQTIRRHTLVYLNKPEVRQKLLNCAYSLVKLRDNHCRRADWPQFGDGFLNRWERGLGWLNRRFDWY